MVTQIILLILAVTIAFLAFELAKQLGWLRKTIDAISSRKMRQQDELPPQSMNQSLDTSEILKLASGLLKEAITEETELSRRHREQPSRKPKRRLKQKK